MDLVGIIRVCINSKNGWRRKQPVLETSQNEMEGERLENIVVDFRLWVVGVQCAVRE